MIYIVMGVTGCGKTTVGKMLAQQLNIPFYDADDYHPQANIGKMSKGIPLTDEDRYPWLEYLSSKIKDWEQEGGGVLACSALKEKYREILRTKAHNEVRWVYLDASPALIFNRLSGRTGHFMPPALIESQFEALEKPSYGIHVDASLTPDLIVQQVLIKLKDMKQLSEFGLVGLGVMGKSLALNLASKGVHISIYNRHVTGVEEEVAKKIVQGYPAYTNMSGFDDLKEFIASMDRPRKILIMIVAGKAVDYQISELLPLLDEGDVLIDGGNSFYKDTEDRTKFLAEKGIYYVGTGISGGEEGARKGPSIMPGGSKEGYRLVAKYLELIAARDKNGKPCTAYIGAGGAGHFIKMVHNGIEYAEMQVLSEAYYLLRFFLGKSSEEIVTIFREWQKEGLGSYLLDITIDILQVKDGNELLLDKILDKAGQKGTGSWSVGAALEHGVAYNTLSEAVMARALSAVKSRRVQAAALYQHVPQKNTKDADSFINSLKNAYQAARVINHEIGFNLMQKVSDDYQWGLDLSETARIWTNGCIIRSQLMEELVDVFKKDESILTTPEFISRMKSWHSDFSLAVAQGLQHGFALPVLSAALNYYLGYITADSPANLLQAQRDYFGAHTYQRIDMPSDQSFHTIWKVL
jgi:6-phosphogluconate dehydrogenase